jgi:hypothetical protein
MLLVGYLWNDTNVHTYVIRKADGIWRASITNKLNRCRELLSRCSCWSFYSTRRVPRRCPRAVFKRSKYLVSSRFSYHFLNLHVCQDFCRLVFMLLWMHSYHLLQSKSSSWGWGRWPPDMGVALQNKNSRTADKRWYFCLFNVWTKVISFTLWLI